jgi:hypothetical protein
MYKKNEILRRINISKKTYFSFKFFRLQLAKIISVQQK